MFPSRSAQRLAERETIRLTATITAIYCQSGPLSVIVIP